MKNVLLLFVLCNLTLTFGQKCPEPKKESFKKVISNSFWKNYKDCPVIVTAEFYKNGLPQVLKRPKKYKKKLFFQVISIGGSPLNNTLDASKSGIPCIVDKKYADILFDFRKGESIIMTGTTFRQKFFGVEIGNFFVATKIEKTNSN